MEIYFSTKKFQKIFESEKKLTQEYGVEQSKKIITRMQILKYANNLADVPTEKPERRHQLTGDRKGQFAVDLSQPYRLIFEPKGQLTLLPDGGIDIKQITHIIILGVENYHD